MKTCGQLRVCVCVCVCGVCGRVWDGHGVSVCVRECAVLVVE